MVGAAKRTLWSTGAVVSVIMVASCTSVREQAQAPKAAVTEPAAAPKSEPPRKEDTKKAQRKPSRLKASSAA